MPYTIQQVAQCIGATWLHQSNPDATVEHLMYDSRLRPLPNALFFALTGPRHDGHQYCIDAYRAGVRQFVVSRASIKNDLPDANILLVENTLEALQQLAAFHRAQFNLPVIGITGSNGKTIVKEWLYQLLRADYDIIRSPKSFNSQLGVPLSVWSIAPQHTLAIFEAGISQPHEMAQLGQIICPDIGIFTNIGPAHSEGFASDAEKVREKMLLFEQSNTLIYCADYPLIETAAKAWYAAKPTERKIIGCTLQQATPLPRHIANGPPFFRENALLCIAVLRHLGYQDAQIAHRMQVLEPVEMRMETKAGINGCTIINDAYNNDLTALRMAIQHIANMQPAPEKRMLVLSDILQTGLQPAVLYRQVAGLIKEFNIHTLIGIGADIAAIRAFLPATCTVQIHPTTDAFLLVINDLALQQHTILLKGARVFEFERIAHRLEQKIHKTHLEINLSALLHNLNVYAGLLRPGTKMLAMVKAAAYGGGAAEIARLLEFHKVDYLGVAYADEGIELREAGVNLPILVLNPEPASFDAMYRFRLEPEVYSAAILDDLVAFAAVGTKNMSIHIKLDTGMHRLGFEPADLPHLISTLQANPHLRVQSVFSHLAASDATQHDAFTHQQAALFTRMSDDLRDGLGYAPLRHIVNTGGIARFPQYHFEMVRLGIGLYGIDSSGLQARLRVVNTLKATISQVKTVPLGETVGYNRNSGTLATERRIATISIGYADGYLRMAGGGRHTVLVQGQLAPTIGNVCMDMTMIDISAIPTARAGDEVVIFGENPLVQALATVCQTIPYEVFTGISARVKRVYIRE